MSSLARNIDTFEQIASDIAVLQRRIQAVESQRGTASRSLSSTDWCKSPLRIIVDNYLETASMAVSPAPWSTYPLSNVLIPDRSLTMLTTAREEHVITVNFDRPRLVNSFAMPYHTMSHWGKVRIELFTQSDQSGLRCYDSGWFLARQRKRLRELQPYVDSWWATYGSDLPPTATNWFDSVLASSARMTLYDQPTTGMPDNFDVGMLFLGLSWSPLFKNFSYGLQIAFEDDVEQGRNAGKGMYVEGTADKYRTSTLSLDALIEEDANLLFEFVRKVGRLKEFFISAYPNYGNRVREQEHGFVARFAQTPARVHKNQDVYTAQLSLGEI